MNENIKESYFILYGKSVYFGIEVKRCYKLLRVLSIFALVPPSHPKRRTNIKCIGKGLTDNP